MDWVCSGVLIADFAGLLCHGDYLLFFTVSLGGAVFHVMMSSCGVVTCGGTLTAQLLLSGGFSVMGWLICLSLL